MARGEKGRGEGPAKSALRKVRTATLVINLARGWQQWANENSTRQAQEPTGWMPGGARESDQPSGPVIHPTTHQKVQSAPKSPSPKPGGYGAGQSSEGATEVSPIKRKEVTKTIVSKAYERGGDVSHLSHRYEKDGDEPEPEQPESDIDRLLRSHGSPTRRRKCANLVSELTKGWKEMEQEEQEELKCRSDSIDTEDSGYGGETEERPEQDGEQVAIARIKRPLPSQANRFTEKLNCKAQRKYSQVGHLKGRWQQWADEHIQSQKLNPFSDEFDYELAMSTRLHKGDEGYGRPKEGTRTAERAKRAEEHIYREIMDMCFIIRTMAHPRRDGKIQVTFGDLFDRYVRISDKVVGILMRARKHGLVDFEGEMLWQGRDDHVVITLLK
ncbi:actin-binding Rho-activating protein [Sus scrofa]|uniref:Actin-binding Rho-activating protein n=1 Tax=Sus scrofa TaxID=9823 RepID=ABRA_PIG|nr:actin-binding Rho-activating protein [Sus scrofa]B5SNZ6.1 RecName: Full=Actin-binding Rho-activating protein; AltName: Full=Striated muscle activator of Rho-dependent signaling; Short=STARS [Sus scrofa]ABG00262.1 striated muscle activator of Rho-dependent signaling [Sus scrofa]